MNFVVVYSVYMSRQLYDKLENINEILCGSYHLDKFNSPLYCEQWNKIKTPWYTPYISSLEAIIYGKHDKTHAINYIHVL